MEVSWDTIVVGGGASGMMAALTASNEGKHKVLLVEKNNILGQKLLITGGGRCNVTNAEPDTRKLLAKFKDSDKFLFSAFSQWGTLNTLEFFNSRGMATKVEAEQRVFPLSNSAQSVWNVLVEELKKQNVTVLSNTPVSGFVTKDGKIEAIKIKGGKELKARSFILATGGKSRPETGSTGEGFEWLKEIGHTVVDSTAALVPVAIEDAWVKRVSGITLPEIKITLLQNEAKQNTRKGKVLFTHFGLSGPTILNMSRDVGELLSYGEVVISLDLLPSLDYGQLNAKLQEIFKEESNKMFKNSLRSLLPSALAPIIVEMSGIKADTQCNSITREERLALVQLLKDIRMKVSGLLGEDKAIITSGGVSLEEIDWKTMRSKLFDNLYLVGDILNIDRPSGGYSLQLCWTTGFVAGKAAGSI